MMRPRGEARGPQALPGKEQSAVKHMMWLLTQKHYKKAIKQADMILKKFPNHGETLSMKGVILSYMGDDRMAEAFEYCKQGLRADISSALCWHSLGVLYRKERDYAEASKAFHQAHRLEPSNVEMLKDLSRLQIHERQLEGFLQSRTEILKLRAPFMREWPAFALANHLTGRLEVAQDLLGEMEKQFGNARELDSYDKSELILYKALILEEMGEYEKCHTYLKEREEIILDKTAMLEAQGRAALISGNFAAGRIAYQRLIDLNKDNECYVLCFMACSEHQEIRELFAVPRCSLAFALGKTGRSRLREMLARDGPSLFSKTSKAHVYLMPGALQSSGEDSAGWLASEFTRACENEASYEDPAMLPTVGWKTPSANRVPPLFVVTRILDECKEKAILSFFRDFASANSPCSVVAHLQLSFLTGSRFTAALDDFLRPNLRRGVVSLFSALRRLYTHNRVASIEAVLTSYVENLESSPSTFGPRFADSESFKRQDMNGEAEEEELPSCLVYAYMLLAQHYDYTRQTAKALEQIEKAIAHTPTFVDLYRVKGRILKHAGAFEKAYELHEKARNLDLADRYLNTKACSYLLRLSRVEEASALARLFSPQHEPEGSHSIQCMWFEMKVGKAQARLGLYAKALGEFHTIMKYFDDIHEEQLEFHGYCLRKLTFRAYTAFLRMHDKLWSHIYFRRAAFAALPIYFAAYDGSVQFLDAPLPSESGKASAKAKKKSATNKKQAGTTAEKNAPERFPKDPPLEAVRKIVDKLLTCCTRDELTHVAHYELASRKGASMAMVLALYRLTKLVAQKHIHSELGPLLYHFTRTGAAERLPKNMHEIASNALTRAFLKEVQIDAQSFISLGDNIKKELIRRCIDNPWDFPARARGVASLFTALKALRLAGEGLEVNSPLVQFSKCSAAASEIIPPLSEWIDLREELEKLKSSEQAVHEFDVRNDASSNLKRVLYRVFAGCPSVRSLCTAPPH